MRIPQAAIEDNARGLDRAERLKVGEGKLDLGALAAVEGDNAIVGGFADYQHRLTKNVAAFGRAEGGVMFGEQSGGFARAIGGIRIRF